MLGAVAAERIATVSTFHDAVHSLGVQIINEGLELVSWVGVVIQGESFEVFPANNKQPMTRSSIGSKESEGVATVLWTISKELVAPGVHNSCMS